MIHVEDHAAHCRMDGKRNNNNKKNEPNTSRALILVQLVAPNCPSPHHTDTSYVDVSVINSGTSRALVPVGIAPLYGY